MNDLPNPVTTVENQLAAIAGDENATLPEPVTRVEMYLDYIAKNGMGGNGAGAHNAMVRGKDLMEVFGETGDTVADVVAKISNQISTGDFSNIFVGDYITATVQVGTNAEEELDFVVAGIDYFYETGDQGSGLTNHHLVLIPKDGFYETMKMNDTNTTTGGYYGSAAHGIASPTYTAGTGGALTSIVAEYETFHGTALGDTSGTYTFERNASNQWTLDGNVVGSDLTAYGITYSGTPVAGDTIVLTYAIGYLEPYRKAIYDAFGESHILNHRAYMTTSTSAGQWHNARVELMNECMVYGSKIYANNSEGERIAPIQLPYFAMNPQRRVARRGKGGSRNAAWLSSIVSGSSFCGVGASGEAGSYGASGARAVRPYFLLS